MSKLIGRFSDWLGRRKRKPRSRLYRVTNRTVTFLAIAYLCLVSFPSFLFAHSVRVGQFDVHSDRPIAANIENVLQDVERLIVASPLYASDESFDIFIAEDDWRRLLLNPRASKASGAYFVATGNIILNRCDIDADLCFNDLPQFNSRPMHSVIAHECTHRMVWNRLGYLLAFRLPTWKHEGYCEYVAGNPSFATERAMALLAQNEKHSSITFRYACWLLAVSHLIDDRCLTVNELFSKDLDFDTELASAVRTSTDG